MTVDHLKVLDTPATERAKPQAPNRDRDTGFADELRATRAAEEAHAAQKREDQRSKEPAQTQTQDEPEAAATPVSDATEAQETPPVTTAAPAVADEVASDAAPQQGIKAPGKPAKTDVAFAKPASEPSEAPEAQSASPLAVKPQVTGAAPSTAGQPKPTARKEQSAEKTVDSTQAAPVEAAATPVLTVPAAPAEPALVAQTAQQNMAPSPADAALQMSAGEMAQQAALAAPNPTAPANGAIADGPGANRQSDKRAAADAAPPAGGKGKAAPAPKAAENAAPAPELAQGKTDPGSATPTPAAATFAAQITPSGGEAATRSSAADAPQAQVNADQKSQAAAPVVQQKFDPGAGLRAETLSQLAVKIAKRFEGQSSTFHIRLDPPELGQVAVKLVMGNDKRVTAKLSTEKPEALEALSARSGELGQALRDLGFNLEDSAMSFDLNSGTNSAFADEREAHGFRGTRITFDAETTKDLVPDSDALGLVQGFAVTRTTRRELRA